MNWPLLRTGLFIMALATMFNLGRLSVEFSGTRSDWAALIAGVVTLISSLMGSLRASLCGSRNEGRRHSHSVVMGSPRPTSEKPSWTIAKLVIGD